MINLGAQLAQLQDAQLVRPLGEEEATYIFKHALTQEAAYQSLLQKQRRELHRRVAQAYEAQYGDQCLDDYAGILAQHYAQAEDNEQTVTYATRAGDLALQRYANTEAIKYYSLALKAALKSAATPSDTLRHLYAQRGRTFQLSGEYDRALANYDEMESIAHRHADRALEMAALIERATIYATPNIRFDRDRSIHLSERALEIARALNDRPSEAKILWNLLLANHFGHQIPQAIFYGEQARDLARTLNLREQLAYALNDLHRSYLVANQVSDARTALREARELWRTLDNPPMLADNLVASSTLAFYDGDVDQATAWREEAYQISQRIGNQWGQAYSRMQASMIYQVGGDFGKAIAAMEESIRAGDQGGFELASTAMRLSLGLVYGYLGDFKRAERWLQDSATGSQKDTSMQPMTSAGMVHLAIWKNDLESAQKYLDATRLSALSAPKNPQTDYWMNLADANLACARQDWHQAIAAADKLIAMANMVVAQTFLPQAYEIKGRAQLALGQSEQAHATLSIGRDQAIRFRERRILWEIYADLYELETQRGNSAPADEWKLLARQTLDEIIATIPTPELKESFLQTPRVRALRT